MHAAVKPGFYSANWLFLGKCYLQLGHVSEGKEWLKKLSSHSMPSDANEDLEIKQEAVQLLMKL